MNLLLAAGLLLQDKTAEEAFKKIEQVLLAAKTVRVRYTGEYATTTRYGTQYGLETGFLALKEGNKAYAYNEFHPLGEPQSPMMVTVSDGQTLEHRSSQEREKACRHETPASLTKTTSAALLRFGATGAVLVVRAAGTTGPQQISDPEKTAPTSGFKVRKVNEKVMELTFEVKSPHYAGSTTAIETRVTLEYDATTFIPIRRIEVSRFDGYQSTTNETYTDFTLNADIPDEKFKLPEEKK